MPKLLSEAETAAFRQDGFHFPVRVLADAETRRFSDALEAHEATAGGPLASNMRHKVHLLFAWAAELVRHPRGLCSGTDKTEFRA